MAVSEKILREFITETKTLIVEMHRILDNSEGNLTLASGLEMYGQFADRIMGVAKNIALTIEDKNDPFHKMADYTSICKAVGYQTSQITGQENEGFYNLCVALLMDATDVLSQLIELVEKGGSSMELKDIVSATLIDRVRWASSKFSKEFRSSVPATGGNRLNQEDIDKLIIKLGF
jgi:hypothetical protein